MRWNSQKVATSDGSCELEIDARIVQTETGKIFSAGNIVIKNNIEKIIDQYNNGLQ
jgi:hypothetical protein